MPIGSGARSAEPARSAASAILMMVTHGCWIVSPQPMPSPVRPTTAGPRSSNGHVRSKVVETQRWITDHREVVGLGAALRRQQVGVTQLVDDLIRDTDHVEVHDAAGEPPAMRSSTGAEASVRRVRRRGPARTSLTVRSGPVTSAETAASGASFQLNSSRVRPAAASKPSAVSGRPRITRNPRPTSSSVRRWASIAVSMHQVCRRGVTVPDRHRGELLSTRSEQ
jgi:hypothetical protein